MESTRGSASVKEQTPAYPLDSIIVTVHSQAIFAFAPFHRQRISKTALSLPRTTTCWHDTTIVDHILADVANLRERAAKQLDGQRFVKGHDDELIQIHKREAENRDKLQEEQRDIPHGRRENRQRVDDHE
jgi:hypothetical protein